MESLNTSTLIAPEISTGITPQNISRILPRFLSETPPVILLLSFNGTLLYYLILLLFPVFLKELCMDSFKNSSNTISFRNCYRKSSGTIPGIPHEMSSGISLAISSVFNPGIAPAVLRNITGVVSPAKSPRILQKFILCFHTIFRRVFMDSWQGSWPYENLEEILYGFLCIYSAFFQSSIKFLVKSFMNVWQDLWSMNKWRGP